jgi:hypothetical protein
MSPCPVERLLKVKGPETLSIRTRRLQGAIIDSLGRTNAMT